MVFGFISSSHLVFLIVPCKLSHNFTDVSQCAQQSYLADPYANGESTCLILKPLSNLCISFYEITSHEISSCA